MGNDPVQAVHLNTPSINAPVMPGRLTTTRVADNASGLRERFETWTDAPAGSTITVRPRNFTVEPGGSTTITITIESDAPIGTQQFGTIWMESRRGQLLHIPVAFVHTQGSVNLVQTCSPLTIQKGGQTRCEVEGQNNSFDTQVVDLDTFTSRNPNLRIIGTEGAALINAHHAQRHNVTLAGFQPGVPAVDPGESPGGYLPLDGFGVEPTPIGDEEIVNFTLSGGTFEFAGQAWNAFGVDSNGYLIVGGGSAEDNNCCNLPAGPDPERPNNVLAPFWTDLDGTASEGIFVTVLTDGTNEWIVVEWRVHVFGTTDLRTFQTWIGLNDVEDISYTYAAPQTDPGLDFLVGAENVLGLGDMAAELPTGDLRVMSSDPVPGDRVSYAVIIRGTQKGTGNVTTEMEASNSPGVTIVRTRIRVI
jgi:Fibronectin type-III domain